MTSPIWKLRNAIWAAPGYIDDEDKKRFRWLSEGNEQQRTVLKEALGYGHPLRGAAVLCGRIDNPDTNYIQRCRIPLCPRCFMTERSKQIRQATRKRFAGVANEQLAFATILLPMTTALSEVSDIIETEKTRIRNMASLKWRKDSRWDGFEILGWWEIDRMTYGDLEQMGRKSRIALEDLGVPLVWYDDTTIWRPHLHAIVRLDNLSTSEVADAFRKNGHGAAYQVDIQPFSTRRRVGLNIKSVIQYALKFRIEDDFKATVGDRNAGEYDLANRKWWPVEDIKEYAEWLCMGNSGFQSLRFSLGAKGKIAGTAGNSPSAIRSTAEPNALPSQNVDDEFDGRELLEEAFDDRFDHSGFDEEAEYYSDRDYTRRSIVGDQGIADWGSPVGSIRYKNPYTDTNWIGFPADQRPSLLGISCSSMAFNKDALSKTHRSPGNTISLAERLRSLGLAERANGDRWSGEAR